MMEDGEDGESKLAARFAKHAQDFDDLQNELAGRDVGRISRFLNADAREARVGTQKRDARQTSVMTALQVMMMNDPEYAQLYREIEKHLRDVQTRLDTMLETVLRAKEEAEERLRTAQNEAERLAQQERLDELTELENDIRSGQADIGDMQLRLEDEENPPSKDEMTDFQIRADEKEAAIREQAEKLEIIPPSIAPDTEQPVFSQLPPDIPKL